MEEDEYYRILYEEESIIGPGGASATGTRTTTPKTPKREDALSWSDFFMSVAFLCSQRSPDPRTKVGACIVNPKNKIVAIGHNDLPVGCVEELQLVDFKFDWTKRNVKEDRWENTKYPYVVHAAINAILNKNAESLEGCTLYTTLFPGHEDAKLIIQSGIKKVVYYEKMDKLVYVKISEDNLKTAYIECTRYPACANPWTPSALQSKSVQTIEPPESSSDISTFPDLKAFPQPSHKDKKGPPINKNGDTDSSRDFYMGMALLTAQRSKDPHRQVGACIVNKEGKVVGFGYNGLPYGFDDDIISWGKFKEANHPKDTKYPYVVHAEANAIMHKTCIDLKGCTIFVTLFPCNECAKLIIQSGIENIYYLEGEPKIPSTSDQDGDGAPKDKLYAISSRRLFEMAGYTLLPLNSKKHGHPKFCQQYVPSREIEIRQPSRGKRQSSRNIFSGGSPGGCSSTLSPSQDMPLSDQRSSERLRQKRKQVHYESDGQIPKTKTKKH